MTESPDIFREIAQFRSRSPESAYRGKERVIFWPVSDAEIAAAEGRLCFELPEILKRFYRRVGFGKICQNRARTHEIFDPNRNAPVAPDFVTFL